MTPQEIAETKEKMQQALDTEWKRSRYERVRCPSIAKMAEYIKAVFPDLKVITEQTEDVKDTKIAGSRLRNPGKTYEGKRIKVINRNGIELLDHSSVETYRRNTEVAQWILDRENNLDKIKALQEAGWFEVSPRFFQDYVAWSPTGRDEDEWYRLSDAYEMVVKQVS